MERLSYPIESGDYAGAGAASRDLKRHLKRIGAEADAVRRAMIAAYEAEMNVVIHTGGGGRLDATVSDGQLDVDVVDEGPGIPDVSAAMREGFSTASAEARALGFGAGMGLPNIARNSDRVKVTSATGEGTTVSFSIALRPDAADQGARPSSLGVVPELCKDCRHCLVACPTAAVRVRDGRPSVLPHLCVDCTCCIGACAPRALTLLDAPAALEAGGVLAVPPALLAGFGDHAADTVLDELRALGYDEVVAAHPYEDALRREVFDLVAGSSLRAPVISPVCPAAVSLIELKFPALVPHLAPLASPWEALQRDLGDREVTFVVSCPSQRTALLAQQPTDQRRTVTPALVREACAPPPHSAARDGRREDAAAAGGRRRRPARGERRRARDGRAGTDRGRRAHRRRRRGALSLRRRLLRLAAARGGRLRGHLALGRRREQHRRRRPQRGAGAPVPPAPRRAPRRGHGRGHPQARRA